MYYHTRSEGSICNEEVFHITYGSRKGSSPSYVFYYHIQDSSWEAGSYFSAEMQSVYSVVSGEATSKYGSNRFFKIINIGLDRGQKRKKKHFVAEGILVWRAT